MRAVTREKTVITSAARVIGRFHSAWVNRRIEEIIVPAWLTPIQKTKLTMKKPQNAGRCNPVTHSPCHTRIVTATTPAITRMNGGMNANMWRGCRLRTGQRSSSLICGAVRTGRSRIRFLPSLSFHSHGISRVWPRRGHSPRQTDARPEAVGLPVSPTTRPPESTVSSVDRGRPRST